MTFSIKIDYKCLVFQVFTSTYRILGHYVQKLEELRPKEGSSNQKIDYAINLQFTFAYLVI